MSATLCPRMTETQPLPPFGRVAALYAAWRRRSRERADLALIEDRDLRELGLSRSVLAYELSKPFWRG